MSVHTMESMVRWVEENIGRAPTLTAMSAFVGYSPYYCSAKFREHTGRTYKQYVAMCRLRAAARDLCGTGDRITEIAFRYGYLSSESLSRAFSGAFGCTPREYRKASHQRENQEESQCPVPLQGTMHAGAAAD